MTLTTGPAVLTAPPGPTHRVLDVPVGSGDLPAPWAAQVRGRGGSTAWWADADRMLVTTPTAGLYVEGGHRVLVRADDDRARLRDDYLAYAWAPRLLLMQRRRFGLHATLVVAPGGQAVAVGGPSMAGKSTTAIELVRRGWTFAGDDIVPVDTGSGRPMTRPYARPIHLSDAAAARLGADPGLGRPLPGRTKRVYGLRTDLRPRPLDLIVVVGRTAADRVEVEHHPGLVALPRLTVLTDSIGLAARLPALRADLFDWAAQLAAGTRVVSVRRPADRDTVAEMADTVEELAAG
ncbi:hypothetical protein [Nakamurella sp.]|uniref:hypothetical protein n=1 Tax=Nakamurella sp. TaxID=1869182 RepID=UPI003B3B449A